MRIGLSNKIKDHHHLLELLKLKMLFLIDFTYTFQRNLDFIFDF